MNATAKPSDTQLIERLQLHGLQPNSCHGQWEEFLNRFNPRPNTYQLIDVDIHGTRFLPIPGSNPLYLRARIRHKSYSRRLTRIPLPQQLRYTHPRSPARGVKLFINNHSGPQLCVADAEGVCTVPHAQRSDQHYASVPRDTAVTEITQTLGIAMWPDGSVSVCFD